jgi:hypothetical protein
MVLKLFKTIAIGRQFRHFGSTFLMGRVTEVLACYLTIRLRAREFYEVI